MNEDIRVGASIIFDHISEVVEEFCREEGVSLIPWYHDEATWLLRWGENPLRQIEMSFEGNATLISEATTYSLILTPSLYRDDTGERVFRDAHFVDAHMDPKEKYPYIRRDEPIDISAFKTALRKAFNDMNQSLYNRNPRPTPATLPIEDAYKNMKTVFPPSMVKHNLEHLEEGGPALDSTLSAYGIQRNSMEITELRNQATCEELFFRLRHQVLNPKSGGRLISAFIDWDTSNRVEFKLALTTKPSICAFDVVTRITAQNLRGDGSADEPYFAIDKNGSITKLTVPMIDNAATIFGKRCTRNGLMSASPEEDLASIYTSHTGFEVMSSLQESLKSNHIKYASVINTLVEHTEETLEKHFDNSGNDHTYAFKDTLDSKSNPCLATSYYALRILSRLNTNGEKDESAIRSFFLGSAGNNRLSDFIRFMKLCWSPKEGGFASSPRKDANILHTRFALQIIRMMLHNGILDKDDLGWFNPTAVFDFVLSVYSLGGFGFRPDGRPMLLTTRAGVSCVKILETLRANHYFPAMRDFKKKQEEYAAIESNIPLFVDSCKLPGGSYSNQPKGPIESAK